MKRIEVGTALLRVAVMGLAVLAWTLTAGASPAAAGYDFKGLELGAPITAAQVEDTLNTPCVGFGGSTCNEFDAKVHAQMSVRCGSGSDGITACNGFTTVVGAPGRVNVVISADGLLQRVMITEFDADQFDAIFAELQRKFGRPTTITKPVLQNGFGATFQQVRATWTDRQHRTVSFEKYSGTKNESWLYFGTQQDQQLINRFSQGKKGDL